MFNRIRGFGYERFLGVVGLLFATSAWGGLFFAGKDALVYLDPYWFTVVRYFMSALVFLFILSVFRLISWGCLVSYAPRLFVFGMCGYAVFGLMVFVGLELSVSAHGAIIMATIPLTATIFRWVIDGVRPNAWSLVACLIAFVGVGMVAGVWSNSVTAKEGGAVWKGDLIVFLGTLGWVVYTRGQQKMSDLSALEYTGLTTLVSLPGVILVGVIATHLGVATVPSLEDLVVVAPEMAYVVCFATVLAVVSYNFGIRRLGPVSGVAFINMVPVSALLIGFFKGQNIGEKELWGAALVVSGLLLLVYGMRRSALATVRRS